MVILAFLTSGGLSSASAQAEEMVGERVRVELPGEGSTEGVVLEWGPTLLGLRTMEGARLDLPWADVRDVAQYRERRRAASGLALGGLAGVVVGGFIGGALVDPCTGGGFCIGPGSRGEGFVIGAGVGALMGGLAGALAGALITTSSWEPVVMPSAGPDLAGPLQLHLQFALSF